MIIIKMAEVFRNQQSRHVIFQSLEGIKDPDVYNFYDEMIPISHYDEEQEWIESYFKNLL